MTFDINRDLAEDAAMDYPHDADARKRFVTGWLLFCEGNSEPLERHFKAGWIAARDAPDD